jgi:hypothetical protein
MNDLERLQALAQLRQLAARRRAEQWAARQREFAIEEEAARARRAAALAGDIAGWLQVLRACGRI